MNLVKCETCGVSLYEEDAYHSNETNDLLCDKCNKAEHDEWLAYFNRHGAPLSGTMENIEVVEVLDVVDPPYCADVAIEFDCNGKHYSACAGAINAGEWEFDNNSTITDIEEVI